MVNPILALAMEFGVEYYDQGFGLVGYEKGSSVLIDNAEMENNELAKAKECMDMISWGLWGEAIDSGYTSAPDAGSAREGLLQCGWETPTPQSFAQGSPRDTENG